MQLFLRSAFPFLRFKRSHLFMALTVPLLSGCFEISNNKGKAQALLQEKAEVEKNISIYDQHIRYYESLLPADVKIENGVDPHYEALSGYMQQVENELANVKVNVATANTYLKMLREESSRTHSLDSAE